MRSTIVQYCIEVCKRWGLECIYIKDRDVWLITKRGRAVDGFTTQQFYQVPKFRRLLEIGMKMQGLQQNLGEKTTHDQVYHKRNLGTVIYGK